MSNLILILWLGLMSYTLYLAYLTVTRVKAARLSPKRRRNREDTKQVFRQWQGNKFDSKIRKSKSHGLSRLWHQLLIRVNFDIPTAERLVANLQRKHPGKNDKWYIEKAIWDLERDKGRY